MSRGRILIEDSDVRVETEGATPPHVYSVSIGDGFRHDVAIAEFDAEDEAEEFAEGLRALISRYSRRMV